MTTRGVPVGEQAASAAATATRRAAAARRSGTAGGWSPGGVEDGSAVGGGLMARLEPGCRDSGSGGRRVAASPWLQAELGGGGLGSGRDGECGDGRTARADGRMCYVSLSRPLPGLFFGLGLQNLSSNKTQ